MADDGSNASGDDWWDAVSKLTGYEPEARDKLFDPSLLGNNKIPLMKLEIDDYDVEPEDAELAAINDLGQWRMQNSGWRVQNTDFVVPFYSGGPGVGSIVTMRRARITLLGTTGVNEEYGPNGGVNMGATFTEHGSKLMGDNFGGWDSRPLARYSFGGGMALNDDPGLGGRTRQRRGRGVAGPGGRCLLGHRPPAGCDVPGLHRHTADRERRLQGGG